MRYTVAPLLVGLLALPALAVPVVDGTRDAEYGAPVAIQTLQTGFGDANPLGGSELDAAYAKVVNSRLYLMFTGNLEPNFNKLEVFIDSVPGGIHTLSGVPQYDFSPSPGFWISQNLQGLRFDSGLDINFHLFAAWGGPSNPYEVGFVNIGLGDTPMVPGSSEASQPAVGLVASGVIPAGDVGPNASRTALTQNLEFAINNNNTAGVSGGTGAADQVAAAAITTGMEFSIALTDLGPNFHGPPYLIFVAAMINNADHNNLSNQILGPLRPNPANTPPSQGNLGGDGIGGFTGTLSGVDLERFAGSQYFIVLVPEPSTIVLAGLALFTAAVLARRSQRSRRRVGD